MKNIFVTITEFLENGGKLEIGRQLFSDNVFNKEIEPVGTYLFTDSEDYVVYNKSNNEHNEDGFDYLYVQINCTPIYQ